MGVRNIQDIAFFNLSAPNGMTALMQAFMAAEGLPYTNAKTVAVYSQDFKQVAVGLATVNFVPNTFTYADSEHFLVMQMAVYDGANATLGVTDWEPGVSDAIAKNGTVAVSANGTQVLAPTPLTRFIQSANNATIQGYYIDLPKPILIRAQTNFQITGSFSPVIATANYNLNVQLTGIKLI